MRRKLVLAGLALAGMATAVAVALVGGPGPEAVKAASHREAPLIARDPSADITDFFMFRSYEPGKDDKLVLLMNVMSEEPSSGPNYWSFDPNVTYRIELDNDRDGRADDVSFEFKFRDEIRGVVRDLGLPLGFVGGIPAVPAIDSFESAGLGLRQTYSVTMENGRGSQSLASGLVVVPSNVGPRTMPSYEALANMGVYDLGNGIRAFAGQRDDPFYIDLGAVFDTLNLRSPGVDMLSGFNVHTIALEIPISLVTADGKGPETTAFPKIGAYASTLRPRVSVVGQDGSGPKVQVQRLANPLVNEVIIGTIDKDRWNRTEPEDEAQFLDYYRNPRFATALNLVFGAPVPATPRDDLRDLLLKYDPSDTRLSELLRLDVSVDPTPLGAQQRLTVLAGDPAGWPNGRRPIDDVTDVAVQVVGGAAFAGAGDAVDANDRAQVGVFPFLATPHDGRGRFHANP